MYSIVGPRYQDSSGGLNPCFARPTTSSGRSSLIASRRMCFPDVPSYCRWMGILRAISTSSLSRNGTRASRLFAIDTRSSTTRRPWRKVFASKYRARVAGSR